jgi:hypothetical protein
MHMQALIDWLRQSALNEALMDSAWAWPLLEILHFMGLSLLLGALIVFDLRMCGLFAAMPVTALRSLPRQMIAGFIINMTSGVLFFVGDPGRYAINIGFQVKMLLVLLAGINALWFMHKFGAALPGWQATGDVPRPARVLAMVSLLTWIGVLLLGRLIPYVGTG